MWNWLEFFFCFIFIIFFFCFCSFSLVMTRNSFPYVLLFLKCVTPLLLLLFFCLLIFPTRKTLKTFRNLLTFLRYKYEIVSCRRPRGSAWQNFWVRVCVCERVFARLSSTFFRFSVFLIFIFISILIWFGFIMLFFRSVLFLDLSHMPCVTVALLPSWFTHI